MLFRFRVELGLTSCLLIFLFGSGNRVAFGKRVLANHISLEEAQFTQRRLSEKRALLESFLDILSFCPVMLLMLRGYADELVYLAQQISSAAITFNNNIDVVDFFFVHVVESYRQRSCIKHTYKGI